MSLRYQDYPNLPDGHIIIEGRDYPYVVFRRLAGLANGEEIAIGFINNRAAVREINSSQVKTLEGQIKHLYETLTAAEAEIERLKAKALKRPERNKMIGESPADK